MNRILFATLLAGLLTAPSISMAQSGGRTVARLFWQDAADQSLKWGDLKQGDSWSITPSAVDGFPVLDPQKQSHVQMQQSDGILLTGVHDNAEGNFQSGWVAVESGVTREEHGNHFHWHMASPPMTKLTRLDQSQGNPAHVYDYGGNFYLANDKKNGFTIVTPGGIRSADGSGADHFVSAGGGHITLAAVDNQVVYATWIDRDGENLGRVDVVGLGSSASAKYAFHLPSGGIHGATTIANKVFFAPADGICWVDADKQCELTADSVKVQHLSLGTDAAGLPLRTGAFEVHRNHVLCNAGRGPDATLCLIDASSPKPSVIHVDLDITEGSTVSTPTALRSRTGEDLAFLFQESQNDGAQEKLLVVKLDPNRDGDYADAFVNRRLVVGRSQIEGHSGHHELASLGAGRFLALSNPGDGSIWIISLSDFSILAKLNIGGTPTRLIAVGE